MKVYYNKIISKLIFCIVLISFMEGCKSTSNENDLIYKEEALVSLAPARSFSLLTMSIDKGMVTGSYSPDPIATFIGTKDPDVIALQDIDIQTNELLGKDLVSDVVYRCRSQKRQGVYAPIVKQGSGFNGVALITKGCFNGTARFDLDDCLSLLTMKFKLISGEEVMIATCQFDRESKAIRLKQANALVGFAEKQAKNMVIAASIYENATGDVLSILKKTFRSSCKFTVDNTYPINNPQYRYDYILTPLSQKWGTQFVEVVADKNVSTHKGILIRIGLK